MFQASLGINPRFLSFSQRSKEGFRNNTEFDNKRILLSDSHQLTILGLPPDNNEPFEILTVALNDFIGDDSKVLLATLVLDIVPNYVIIVSNSLATLETSILILKLTEDDQPASDHVQSGVVPTAKIRDDDMMLIKSSAPASFIVDDHFKKDNFERT
jgi:hypothetical protein